YPAARRVSLARVANGAIVIRRAAADDRINNQEFVYSNRFGYDAGVTNGQASRLSLLSDEPTVELVLKARGGDRAALEALVQRCIPSLTRWAHGRLPMSARGSMDTGDLVQ